MKRNNHLSRILLATSIIVASETLSVAQSTNNSSAQTSLAGSSMSSDTAFIRKNIMDNMTEIQLLELAQSKSSSQQLKNMSRQMIADHTQMLGDLHKIAVKKNMNVMDNNGMASGSSSNNGTGTNSGNMAGTTPVDGSGTGITTNGSNSTTGMTGSGTGTTGSLMGTAGNSQKRSSKGTTGSAMGNSGVSGSTSTGSTNDTSGASSSANTTGSTSSGNSAAGTTGTSSVDTTRSSSTTATHQGMENMSSASGMGDMIGMQALQNASGPEFNKLFVSQMLAMHQAKLSELEAASTKITDPELKLAVVKAIPKIRMHTDMLSMASKRNQ